MGTPRVGDKPPHADQHDVRPSPSGANLSFRKPAASKGVKFSSLLEEQHLQNGVQIVTVVNDGNRASKAKEASSRSAARRRKRWRRCMMRLQPRYWLYVLNKRMPVVHPETRWRLAWDFMILFFVVFNCVLVPYQVGFSTPFENILEPLNYAIDSIFLMDIILNFRTAYVDETATLIRDGRTIATHYLRTWFPVDAISTMPFDLILSAVPNNLNQTQLTVLSLLRTPRLLRLVRLLRMLDRIKGANAIRMLKLLFLMATLAHWITCLWHLLFKVLSGAHRWTFDELGPNAAEITHFLDGYLNTLYIMVGNDVQPENDYETLYCTFVLVIGACFYAIIVGNMSLLINNMNPTASRHKFRKDIINNTVRYLGLPANLTIRINDYFDYLTQYSHPGSDGLAHVGQLPHSMAEDINSWFFRDFILKVPLFVGCENAFITTLVMRVKLVVFLTGEVIFKIGDVGHEMYCITKGHVAVLNANQELLAVLEKGGFFGELALLATARRTAQCISISSCDLAMLMANDLVSAMRDFPDSGALVRDRAVNRLSELQATGAAGEQQYAEAPAHLRKINHDAAEVLDQQEKRGFAADQEGEYHEPDSSGAHEHDGQPSPFKHQKELEARPGSGRSSAPKGITPALSRAMSTRSVLMQHLSVESGIASPSLLRNMSQKQLGSVSRSASGRFHRPPQKTASYLARQPGFKHDVDDYKPARRPSMAQLGTTRSKGNDAHELETRTVLLSANFVKPKDWLAGSLDIISQVYNLGAKLGTKIEVLDTRLESMKGRLSVIDHSTKEAAFGAGSGNGSHGRPGAVYDFDY